MTEVESVPKAKLDIVEDENHITNNCEDAGEHVEVENHTADGEQDENFSENSTLKDEKRNDSAEAPPPPKNPWIDEVGLAEDSPLMPLKTLHPLLEDGVTSADDVIETDEKPQRVAFVGISNWALDPAKMNRGIMLSRGVPDVGELVDSAL